MPAIWRSVRASNPSLRASCIWGKSQNLASAPALLTWTCACSRGVLDRRPPARPVRGPGIGADRRRGWKRFLAWLSLRDVPPTFNCRPFQPRRQTGRFSRAAEPVPDRDPAVLETDRGAASERVKVTVRKEEKAQGASPPVPQSTGIPLNRAQHGMRCFWIGSAPADSTIDGVGAVQSFEEHQFYTASPPRLVKSPRPNTQ